MGDSILFILNNEELTMDEKTILLKKLAAEMNESEKVDKRQELIEKNREQAKENRARVAQINYDGQVNEQMEILSFLKNKMGENQYSMSYLSSLSGLELSSIYEDCLRTMPDAMAKARDERAKARLEEKEKVASAASEEPSEAKPEEVSITPEEPSIEEPVDNSKDLDTLANNMTDEEMNYILNLQKIADESNISLEEAEKVYMARNTGANTSKPEEVQPELSKVKVKSIDRIGVVKKHNPNGTYLVQILGEDDSFIEVPATDLDIVDENVNAPQEPKVETPENIDVNAKPGLKDTMTIPAEDIRKAMGDNDQPLMPELNKDRVDEVRAGGSFPNVMNVVKKNAELIGVREGRKKVKKITNLFNKFKEILGFTSQRAVDVVKHIELGDVSSALKNSFSNNSDMVDDSTLINKAESDGIKK